MGELYKSAGYEPFLPTAEQLAAVRALDAALADATRNEMLAAATAAAAGLAVSPHAARPTTLMAAAADIAAGSPSALPSWRASNNRRLPGRPPTRKSKRGTRLYGPLRSKVELAVQAALEAKKVAEFDARSAADRLDAAAADLEKARRGLGVQLPLDEIVFIPGLPVRSSRGHGSGRRRGERSCAVGDEQSDDDRLVRRPRRSAAVEAGDGGSVDEPAYAGSRPEGRRGGGEHARHRRRRRIPHLLCGSR